MFYIHRMNRVNSHNELVLDIIIISCRKIVVIRGQYSSFRRSFECFDCFSVVHMYAGSTVIRSLLLVCRQCDVSDPEAGSPLAPGSVLQLT